MAAPVAPPAGIAQYDINDLATFNAVTGKGREVAGIYFFAVLDSLIELSCAISGDFFKRPHLYVNSKGVAKSLAELRSRPGTDELFPSKAQRAEVYGALTGQGADASSSNGVGDFPRLRDQLVGAATAFAERVYDTGEQMLRERVRVAHRPFKEYLDGLSGASLTWSRDNALPAITEKKAYAILRDAGVAAVFSQAKPPIADWPYAEDPNADKMVEEVAKQLGWMLDAGGLLTRETFTNLQSVAKTGAVAIATAIDFDSHGSAQDLDQLITKVYTWGAEVKTLQS